MSTAVCAYQGERGAYSELAAKKLLGEATPLLACADFVALFQAVTTARARWGVVPVENTLAGPVAETQALLKRHAVMVLKAMQLHIRHALIGKAEAKLEDIREAWSHPVALRQCRRFFELHSAISAVATHDTAGAVARITRETRMHVAAIAGAHCAEIYGGQILLDDIADQRDNYTRFFLIQSA